MLKQLLEQWSKTPEPWFSKRYLEGISAKSFRKLEAKKILVYDVPTAGEETIYEPRCPHGCALFAERNGNCIEAVCLSHPDEGAISISEDQLSRYRFSVINLLREIVKVNQFQGEISPHEDGFRFGHVIKAGKRIGFVIYPSVVSKTVSDLLKDEDCVMALSADGRYATQAITNDRIVTLGIRDVLNFETCILDMEAGFSALRRRQVVKNIQLSITGDLNESGENVIEINKRSVFLSDAPFLLLLRLMSGIYESKDRWVSVQSLISEGVTQEDRVHRDMNRLKEKIEPYLPDENWNLFIGNGWKKYRVDPNVDAVTYDRKKLIKLSNGRIVETAKKLPQCRRVLGGKKRSHKK